MILFYKEIISVIQYAEELTVQFVVVQDMNKYIHE